jgi:phenylpyruvate tautomerase PptA (4-oxalocrotonate tautomerase family)
MPLMDLTYPAGALTPAARAALADELTTVLLRAERAPDTEFFRSITWLHVHELPDGLTYSAGTPVPSPTFRLEVSVPAGALSDRRKQELVAGATTAILDAAGIEASDALQVWVLIRDVPEGNWGAAGSVIHFEQLRQVAAEQRAQQTEAGVAGAA